MRRLGITPFVVDPVAASQHGDPLLRPDALDALRDVIIPLATLVTPNLGEVRLLTGVEVRTRADMDDAAQRAARARAAVGAGQGRPPAPSGDAVDMLYDGDDVRSS